MQRKNLVIFVDDAQRELDLFRKAFSDDFEVFTAFSAMQAKLTLTPRVPDLIVLDVSFTQGDGVADKKALEAAKNAPSLQRTQGVQDTAEVLRIASLNEKTAAQMRRALQKALKNNVFGGMDLARAMNRFWPNTPIVAYSRKSDTQEVLYYLANIPNVRNFIQKPESGKTWDETVTLTMQERPRIVGLFTQAIVGRGPGLQEAARLIVAKVEHLQLFGAAAGLSLS